MTNSFKLLLLGCVALFSSHTSAMDYLQKECAEHGRPSLMGYGDFNEGFSKHSAMVGSVRLNRIAAVEEAMYDGIKKRQALLEKVSNHESVSEEDFDAALSQPDSFVPELIKVGAHLQDELWFCYENHGVNDWFYLPNQVKEGFARYVMLAFRSIKYYLEKGKEINKVKEMVMGNVERNDETIEWVANSNRYDLEDLTFHLDWTNRLVNLGVSLS